MLAIFNISATEFQAVHAAFTAAKREDWYERNAVHSHYKQSTVECVYLNAFCPKWGDTRPLRAGYSVGNGDPVSGEFLVNDTRVNCKFAFYMTSGSNLHGVFKVTPQMRSAGYPLAIGFYAIYKGARSCSMHLEDAIPRLRRGEPAVYQTTGDQEMLWWDNQATFLIRHPEKALAYFQNTWNVQFGWDDLSGCEMDVLRTAMRDKWHGWESVFSLLENAALAAINKADAVLENQS